MLDIFRHFIRVILWGLIFLPSIVLGDVPATHCFIDNIVVSNGEHCKNSDVLIWAGGGGKKRFLIEGDAKKVIGAGLSFCDKQEFQYDKLNYNTVLEGGFIYDSRLIASCSFSDKDKKTPLQLKQLQYRTVSMSPAKTVEAVKAWKTFRQPVIGAHPTSNHMFVIPQGSHHGYDKDGKTILYKDYKLIPYSFHTLLELDYTGNSLDIDTKEHMVRNNFFYINIEVLPPPPLLNNDGFWGNSPSVQYGNEGDKTTVRMSIVFGERDDLMLANNKSILITKPELYNRLFKEIANSAFIETIEFEPIPIE